MRVAHFPTLQNLPTLQKGHRRNAPILVDFVRSSGRGSYSTSYVRFEQWKDLILDRRRARKGRAFPLLATFLSMEAAEAFVPLLRIFPFLSLRKA